VVGPPPAGFAWTPARTVALALLCLAQLLDVLDATIVNVALPAIQRDLGFTPTDLQWVISAYTVVFGGALLLGGRLGDLVGRRRILLAGIVVFTLASVASGLAGLGGTGPGGIGPDGGAGPGGIGPDGGADPGGIGPDGGAGMLVGARAAQGLGAALVAPMTLAMIASIFPEGAPRNRAVAIWGAVTATGGSLGLIAGGALVDGPGWRWTFLVNVPFGLLILLAGWWVLPADRPARRHRRFDAVGAVTSTAGLCLLAYAVTATGTAAWTSTRVLAPLAGAAALLAWFVVHEALLAGEPLMPFRLLRIRAVAGANAVQLLVGGAMYALFYFASLYLQEVRGYSAFGTGAALAPFTIGILALSALGPPLLSRIGTRAVLVAGSLVGAAGFLAFTGVSPTGGLVPTVILPSLVLSLGLALMFVPLTIASVSGVPGGQHGIASGLLNVNRTVGGALGLAVLSSLAAGHTSRAVRGGAALAVARTGGYRLGFLVAAGLLALSAVIAFALFRGEGRGRRVDLTALTTAGLDG
jgi:MFS family permease